MGLLNAFNATIWATPLVIGFAMGQCLRRKMTSIGRAAMWVTYLAWACGWISIWHSINSGGSGRFAIEQWVFDACVKGTTLLGAGALGWAEIARRDDAAARSPRQ
jgi:hypothetical protein